MKNLTAVLLAVLTLAAGSTRTPATEVPWSAFTGGGGVAQHGAVALGGAIGAIAPATASAVGADFVLWGGFWSALSDLPQAAEPVLKVRHLGGNQVRLSWPVAFSGFTLEYTTQLGSGVWLAENTAVVDTPTEHTVTVAASALIQAYRLRSQ